MTVDQSTIVVLGVIAQLAAIVGGLWALARRLARLEMMVDLMWDEFAARFGIRQKPRK